MNEEFRLVLMDESFEGSGRFYRTIIQIWINGIIFINLSIFSCNWEDLYEKRIVEFLDSSLKYCLVGILLLAALMVFFVFTINWEDWLFGIKLDGMPAGLYLLVKGLSAAALVFLIVKCPRYIQQLVIAAMVYFGYLFIDSAATMQKLTYARQFFSVLLGVFVMIPVVFLIVHGTAQHLNEAT